MPTIRKRNGRFQAQVRIKKEGAIVYQDSATFDTKKQAELWGYALEAKINKHGVETHYTSTNSVTDIMMAYAAYREKVRPMGRGMQHSIRAVCQAPFALKGVNSITAAELTQWGLELQKRVAPATVMHHFMTLRAAYNSALSLVGFTPDLSPVLAAMQTLQKVKAIGRSQARERRITDAEIDLICDYLRGRQLSVPTDTYVRLAVALPRRREELLTMCWSDYTGQTIRLRDTKNPTVLRNEVVPVPVPAQKIISNLPRFDGDDRILPFKPESVSAAFQRAVRELGIEDIRLHDLRHEGISRLFEQGLSIPEVSLISGHVSWTALRRYTHIKPLDVLEKLNASSKRTQKDSAEPE
jgi:integrase